MEIKPCPFCGHNGNLDQLFITYDSPSGDMGYFIKCEACWSEGAPKDKKQEAIAAWNRRVGDE